MRPASQIHLKSTSLMRKFALFLISLNMKMDVDIDALISLIKDRPGLHDKTYMDYVIKIVKKKSWEEVQNLISDGSVLSDTKKKRKISTYYRVKYLYA